VMEMLEHNGGAGSPKLAGGNGEGESGKCSHIVDDKVVTGRR